MPGIWMSRKITSGLCDASAWMPFRPSSASATISNSGQSAASASFNSPRSSGSSSATIAVGRLMRNLHDKPRAAAIRSLECKRPLITVEGVQTLLDDVQIVGFELGVEAATAIDDLDAQLAC